MPENEVGHAIVGGPAPASLKEYAGTVLLQCLKLAPLPVEGATSALRSLLKPSLWNPSDQTAALKAKQRAEIAAYLLTHPPAGEYKNLCAASDRE